MTTRPLRAEDLPHLNRIAAANGYEYVDPTGTDIEADLVVVDDDGRLLMACAAQRIVQLFLWSEDFGPAAKLHAIRLLHREMGVELRQRGYTEANAFPPPSIAERFGRRLERTFQWVHNWPSWAIRF